MPLWFWCGLHVLCRAQRIIYRPVSSSYAPDAGAIDADEFVMIMDGSPSLPAILHDYEAYGGLVVNWRAFGSSGHLTR